VKKEDKELAHKRIVELVGGLLGEHVDQIVEAHQKMENSLAVNLRLTLKND